MSGEFKIWIDSSNTDPDQGHYIIEHTILRHLSPKIERVYSNDVRAFARNPKRIQDLLYLDKPDVIITHRWSLKDVEEPVLCIEFSEQTPMGQNVYQRFPRAVASAEAGVPFAFVFPERDWVPRSKGSTSSWEYASPFVFNSLRRLTDLHKLPVISIDWPFRETPDPLRGYKIYDPNFPNMPDSNSDQAKDLFQFVTLVLENHLQRGSVADLFKTKFLITKLNEMDEKRFKKGAEFISKVPSRGSGIQIKTSDLDQYVNDECHLDFDPRNLPDHVLARPDSFIFYAKTKNFRADPYTGTLLVYDYSFCRYGPRRVDRHTNLIVHFPIITSDDLFKKYSTYYKRRCPFRDGTDQDALYLTLHLRDGCRYTKQKEFRVFFSFADVVIIKDAVLF